jgi:hypothetical protein
MLILKKIYCFATDQFRVKNGEEVFLLLLKLAFVYFVIGEICNDFLYLRCIIKYEPQRIPFYMFGRSVLIVVIYCLYLGVRYLRKKGVCVMRKVVTYFVMLCIATSWINGSVLGIFFWDGPYWGRVTDAGTGEPLEGVRIAGHWIYNFGPMFYNYSEARETVTGKRGWFFLPAARGICFVPFYKIRLDELIMFKPGYDSNPPRIYPSDCKRYKPIIARLNKAETTKARREAVPDIGFSSCESCRIRKMVKTINKERKRVYGPEAGRYEY